MIDNPSTDQLVCISNVFPEELQLGYSELVTELSMAKPSKERHVVSFTPSKHFLELISY